MADTRQSQPGAILAFTGTMRAADSTSAADPIALLRAQQEAQAAFVPVGVLDDPPPAEAQRAKRLAKALQAFEGELPDPFPRTRNPRQPDNNAKSNRCERIVTAGVDFLFGKDLDIQLEAAGDGREEAPDAGAVQTGETPAEEYLDAFWRRNCQMTMLQLHALNGGVFGHAFLKLLPAKDKATPPRLVALDPQTVRVECDPDDHTTALAYVIQFRSAVRSRDLRGRLVEKAIDKRQVIERVYDPTMGESPRDAQAWRITDQTRDASASTATGLSGGGSAAAWTTVAQADWPYAWPPIFDNQNLPQPNEYWGRPDLTPDLVELNEVINRVQSNVQKILDNHAGPLTWGKNIGERSIDKDPSKILAFGPDADIKNLEMQSDLTSSLNYLATLRANMDEQSCVPAVALGRQADLPKGNMSGIAIELLFQPLLQKTEKKRRLYGEMLEGLTAAVLDYAGYAQAATGQVKLVWPQILPRDPQADWTVAQQKMAAGVSKRTILEEAGYDPDVEAENAAEEAQRALDAFTQGKGMPPTTAGGSAQPPQSLATGAQSQPSEPASGDAAQPTTVPPTNHPAAVAQRNATKLVAQAAKAGKRVKVA